MMKIIPVRWNALSGLVNGLAERSLLNCLWWVENGGALRSREGLAFVSGIMSIYDLSYFLEY
jgi:hypothetical protein